VLSQRSYRLSYYFIRRFILVRDVPLTTNSVSVSVLKIRKISDCLSRETEDSGPPSCLHKDAYRAQRWEEIERHVDFPFNLRQARRNAIARTRPLVLALAVPIKRAFCARARGHKGLFWWAEAWSVVGLGGPTVTYARPSPDLSE